MKAFTIVTVFIFILSNLTVHSHNLSGTNLDEFIDAIIKNNNIPGLSIAVVSHDSVIYAKGFGIKKTGGSDPIDEHTLFEVVSLTKSFTALLLGMLVDQEKIKWTDPVVKYIPDFETKEDFVTQKLTIKDLLTLRSGLLDGDKLSGSTRMELVPQIKNLKISDSFRLSQTAYNLNYTLARLIVEIISGESWENMMKERIYSPLKMSETFTDIPTALSFKNFPHLILLKMGI